MRQSEDAENVDPRAAGGAGDWPGLAAFHHHAQQQNQQQNHHHRPGGLFAAPLKPTATATGPAPPAPPPPQGSLLAPRRRPALRDITLLMVPQAEAASKDGLEKQMPLGGGALAAPVVVAARGSAGAAPLPASLLPPRPPRAAVASMR